MVPNRRPSLAPAEEAQTVSGKEYHEGQPMEAEGGEGDQYLFKP